MSLAQHNPPTVFPPYRSYSHGIEVPPGARWLCISGLNGYELDGQTLPASFEEQGELVWRHIGSVLRSAGMDYGDLVSIRTYLPSPQHDEANVRLRMKFLGGHRPASTVVCCQLLETAWMLEVEAVAAKV